MKSAAERAAERIDRRQTDNDWLLDRDDLAAIIAEEYRPLVEALKSIADFDCACPDGYKSMRDLRAALRVIESKVRAALGEGGRR